MSLCLVARAQLSAAIRGPGFAGDFGPGFLVLGGRLLIRHYREREVVTGLSLDCNYLADLWTTYVFASSRV